MSLRFAFFDLLPCRHDPAARLVSEPRGLLTLHIPRTRHPRRHRSNIDRRSGEGGVLTTIDAPLVSASFRDRREIVAKDGREGANWDKNFFERYIYIYRYFLSTISLFSLPFPLFFSIEVVSKIGGVNWDENFEIYPFHEVSRKIYRYFCP